MKGLNSGGMNKNDWECLGNRVLLIVMTIYKSPQLYIQNYETHHNSLMVIFHIFLICFFSLYL